MLGKYIIGEYTYQTARFPAAGSAQISSSLLTPSPSRRIFAHGWVHDNLVQRRDVDLDAALKGLHRRRTAVSTVLCQEWCAVLARILYLYTHHHHHHHQIILASLATRTTPHFLGGS